MLVPLTSHLKPPNPAPMPLHPPLSDYPNTTTNHAIPTLSVPTTILIASAGAPLSRSSPFARPASLPFSLRTIFSFYRDTRTILSSYDIPPFRFVARETGPTKTPPPSSTARYLRVYGIVSIMRFGCKLNLSLSLPRGSRIGYDAMICTTSMRPPCPPSHCACA